MRISERGVEEEYRPVRVLFTCNLPTTPERREKNRQRAESLLKNLKERKAVLTTRANRDTLNDEVKALIEAALDQPDPTVCLKLALNRLLTRMGHLDRVRYP